VPDRLAQGKTHRRHLRLGRRACLPGANGRAAWGHAGGPLTARIPLEDHPTVTEIRRQGGLRFSIRICRGTVEPFEFRPDIFLPGTLHHSGYRPAPPSEDIPLARRSAFLRDAARLEEIAFPSIPDSPPASAITPLPPRRALPYKFTASSNFGKELSRERIIRPAIFLAFRPASRSQDLQGPPAQTCPACRRSSGTAGDVPATAWNRRQLRRAIRRNFSVPRMLTPAPCGTSPMNHKGLEYTLTRSETPGVWKWQFRIGDLVRSGRTEARLLLLAMRRVQLKIDRELRHPGRELTS
jgi:hypothetical protein